MSLTRCVSYAAMQPSIVMLTNSFWYLQTEKGMQGIDSRVINPKIGKSKCRDELLFMLLDIVCNRSQ